MKLRIPVEIEVTRQELETALTDYKELEIIKQRLESAMEPEIVEVHIRHKLMRETMKQGCRRQLRHVKGVQ